MSSQDGAARSPRPAAARSFDDLLTGQKARLRAYGGGWAGRRWHVPLRRAMWLCR